MKKLLLTFLMALPFVSASADYTKVTSDTELEEGVNYILVHTVSNGTSKAMGEKSSSYMGSVDVTVSDNTISQIGKALPFQLVSSDGKYQLKTADGNYIVNSTTGTSITCNSTTTTALSVSINTSGNAEISNTASSKTRYIGYYSGGTFRSYTSTSGYEVQLYKETAKVWPTSCADPTFDVADNAEVYPGSEITASCTTLDNTIYMATGSNPADADYTAVSDGKYTVPADAAVGSTITLWAYATVQGETAVLSSNKVSVTVTVIAKPTTSDVTFDFTTSESITINTNTSLTKDDVTISLTGNSGAKQDACFRFYSGANIKISCPDDYYITSIVFVKATGTSKWNLAYSTTPAEGALTNSGNDYTFTPNAGVEKSEFTLVSSGGQTEVASITVHLAKLAQKTSVTLTWSADTASAYANDDSSFTAPTLTVDPTDATSSVQFSSSNESVAAFIDGTLTIGDVGTTTIKAEIPSTDATYKYAKAEYTLTVSENPNKLVAPTLMLGEAEVTDNDVVNTTTQFTISSTTTGATVTYGVKYADDTEYTMHDYEGAFTITLPVASDEQVLNVKVVATKDGSSKEKVYALDIKKLDPALKFSAETVTKYLSDSEAFVAPTLTNEYNLPVTYSENSDDNNVVDVATDGTVTFTGRLGETLVEATTAATTVYKASTADYYLTVAAFDNVAPGNTTGTATITFVTGNNEGNDVTTSTTKDKIYSAGGDLVSSISDITKTYNSSAKGLKLGTTEKAGKITFNMAQEYTINSIDVTASVYVKNNVNESRTVTVKLSDTDSSSYEFTEDGTHNFAFSPAVTTSAITLESTMRIGITGLTINYGTVTPAKAPLAFVDGVWLDGTSLDSYQGKKITFVAQEDCDIYYWFNSYSQAPTRAATEIKKYDGTALEFTQKGNLKYYAQSKTDSSIKSDVVTMGVGMAVVTGVDGVEVEPEAADARFFNLQGVEVANPENGIFIRIQNGKAVKVMM